MFQENAWNYFYFFIFYFIFYPTQIVIMGCTKFQFSVWFWIEISAETERCNDTETERWNDTETETEMHTETEILTETEMHTKTEIFRSLIVSHQICTWLLIGWLFLNTQPQIPNTNAEK